MANDIPMEKLRYIMACLRDKTWGCPWDLEQTPRSIAPFTLEEAYEVVDAVESGDSHHLQEELGDLLLQVVFYSQMAAEQKQFTFDDVVNGISEKLLRRHPHVFPEGRLELFGQRVSSVQKAEDVETVWERIKQSEKQENQKKQSALFQNLSRGLAPLKRAEKLQKAARRVGFDWPDVQPAFAKVAEELEELRTAVHEGHEAQSIEEEFGDLLFAAVNVSRYLKIDPDMALLVANNKFESRMYGIEQRIHAEGKQWQDYTLEELDEFWNQVKADMKTQSAANSVLRQKEKNE